MTNTAKTVQVTLVEDTFELMHMACTELRENPDAINTQLFASFSLNQFNRLEKEALPINEVLALLQAAKSIALEYGIQQKKLTRKVDEYSAGGYTDSAQAAASAVLNLDETIKAVSYKIAEESKTAVYEKLAALAGQHGAKIDDPGDASFQTDSGFRLTTPQDYRTMGDIEIVQNDHTDPKCIRFVLYSDSPGVEKQALVSDIEQAMKDSGITIVPTEPKWFLSVNGILPKGKNPNHVRTLFAEKLGEILQERSKTSSPDPTNITSTPDELTQGQGPGGQVER